MKFLVMPLIWLLFHMGHAQSKEVSITEFSQNDKNIGILIDVRTPEEFKAGHLKDAINVDWSGTDFAEKISALDIAKENSMYLYCQKGGRSARAAKVLDSLGYTGVINLLGGYEAYRAKNKL